MEIKQVKLSEIFPYEKNPRFNEQAVEAIAQSITEFGFLNPIVVDKNMVIICGHTRYKAACLLKLDTVPILIADKLSDAQVKAYRIADNKTSEFATWNYEQLLAEINELQDADYNLSNLGFANDVLADLLYHEEEDIIWDGETPPDALPELFEDENNSKMGAMYELGEHRLLVCDRCDNSLTSTLLYDGNAKLYLAQFWEWHNDVPIWLKNGSAGLSAGGCFYVMVSDADTLNARLSCRNCDLEVHETLLWLKSNFKTNNGTYQIQNDSVFYGWKPGASHKWYSDRKQTNLLQYNNAPSGYPPVALDVYLIRNSTLRHEIVFDNFSKTGNSIIACEQTGRRCRMIVDNPADADLIRKRWAEFVSGEGCNWQKLTPAINRKKGK